MKWNTDREIEFLEGLSGWRSFGCRAIDPERRRMLLKKYKASMKARVNWGEIDPKKISRYLDRVLKREVIKKRDGLN